MPLVNFSRQFSPSMLAACSVTSQSQNRTLASKPIIEESFTHVINIPTWVKVFSRRLHLRKKFQSAEEERQISHVVVREERNIYFFLFNSPSRPVRLHKNKYLTARTSKANISKERNYGKLFFLDVLTLHLAARFAFFIHTCRKIHFLKC